MAGGPSYSKNNPPIIGIDLMGSDCNPEHLFHTLLELKKHPFSANILLFVSHDLAEKLNSPFPMVISKDIILMEDDPFQVMRDKNNSSLCEGLRHLKEGKISALVSAGNTGALLVFATLFLNPLPGIRRPALLTLLPTKKKEVAVLDVGASVTFKPEWLVQFAAMGIAFQKSRGIENPTVGLLNIGREPQKGTPQLKEAYAQLQKLNQNKKIFLGNIESKDLFQGDIDVLVTDGFTGNIFLKTVEGIATFILDQLDFYSELEEMPSYIAQSVSKIKSRLHYTEYQGALLCGVEGIVIKCHGNASAEAFLNGVTSALRLVEHKFLSSIVQNLGGLVF